MKNINILNDLNTLNKLHTSSVESYTTSNGIVDFTCDNAGYVDNVVIEGETLVNLWDVHNLKLGGQSSIVGNRYKCVTLASNRYSDFWSNYSILKPNTTYTVIYNIIQNTLPTGVRAIAITHEHAKTPHAFNETVAVNGGVTGIFTTKLTTKDSFTDVAYGLRSFVDNSTMGDGYIVELEIVLIEGDYTNTPISYFEGLKSVGQGDKIEVLSYSKNLDERLDLSNLTWKDGHYVHIGTGAEIVSESHCYTTNYIPIQKTGCNMVFINANPHIVFYDKNKNVIYQELGYFPSDDLVIVDVPINAKFLRFTGQKSKKNSVSVYYSQYDKKQISTTLRSLPNGVKDTIEKRGNKYVKVQRCRELHLDGNSTFFSISEVNPSTKIYRVLLDIPLKDNKPGGKVFCDRFNSYANWELDEEECYVSINKSEGNAVCLKILKTRLENTMTKEKLLAWLDANPTTIVYELEKPIITELPNFNSQTYKGENTLIVNSGVIQCDASFDVCEGIRSELDVIKDKVSSLDDDYIVDIPIQYLNGWEGSLTCRVNGKCVTLAGMLHGQDVAIKSARTNILKLPINSKAINITTIGLYNVFGQYVGTVELTFDNEIKICHSDFTYNGNYIGLNLSWFLH